MKEQYYPIYSFTAKWSELKNKQRDYLPFRQEGLSEDRVWNSTSWSKMYKEDQSNGVLDKEIQNWWAAYSSKEDIKLLQVELLYLKVEIKEYESWNLTWFCHETFDLGQSDEDILKSFENFVERKQCINDISILETGFEKYPLMGAEDRWRWRGETDQHDPPCRCVHCKEQGMVRIRH